MLIDRMFIWTHYQKGHAGIHSTKTWLEKWNMYVRTKYVKFQMKKCEIIAECLKLGGH